MERYKAADKATFDPNALTAPGEIEVIVNTFTERDINKTPVIGQDCCILRAITHEDDNQFNGQTLEQITFFGDNSGITHAQLKNMFKKAGFDTKAWIPDTDYAPSTMLPCALKWLALNNVRVICKVTRPAVSEANKAKGKEERTYVNFHQISTVDENGSPLELPVLSNEDLVNVWAEKVEGQGAADYKNVI